MRTKLSAAWKTEFLAKLDTLDVWDAVEQLRLQRVTLSIKSVAPFDPKANYCEPFNHDQKYRTQIWDDEDQRYMKGAEGKTPAEAFRKAVRAMLK